MERLHIPERIVRYLKKFGHPRLLKKKKKKSQVSTPKHYLVFFSLPQQMRSETVPAHFLVRSSLHSPLGTTTNPLFLKLIPKINSRLANRPVNTNQSQFRGFACYHTSLESTSFHKYHLPPSAAICHHALVT